MRGHHTGLGDWIVGGIGLAIGFALFKLFAVRLVLVAMALWALTEDWSEGWRALARFVFVLFVAVVVFAVVIVIFSE
jgi:hypothetical protein